MIERIQRNFSRFALRKSYDHENIPSYPNSFSLLGIQSVVDRRTIFSTLFIGDLLSGRIDCFDLVKLLNIRIPTRDLRHCEFLDFPFHRTNYGNNEPMTRTIRCFDNFNQSRDSFKKLIYHKLIN